MMLVKIRTKLSESQLIGYGIGFALLILFHLPVEIFITHYFIQYLFSKVESAPYNDLIILAVGLYVTILAGLRSKDYSPSTHFTVLSLVSAIVYLYYRLNESPWTFTGFSFYPAIKYGDYLLYIAILNLIVYVTYSIRVFRRKETTNSGFLDDAPLGLHGADILGYTEYATNLSKMIDQTYVDNAVAIGVNGTWGSGKTSFFDLVKRKLKKQDIIFVDFSPWNFNSPQALIRDFFEVVANAVKPYHATVSGSLTTYSRRLATASDNDLSNYLGLLMTSINANGNTESLFSEINDAIRTLGKKLVIFIDDLDRLDKDEIVEIIRLIRNTASFNRTFFIVAYDRDYVLNALKEHNSYRHSLFLEKIFQIEIKLPSFKNKKIAEKLFEQLRLRIDVKYHHLIDLEMKDLSPLRHMYIFGWLETIRDVTRLVNAISLNLASIIGEVEFSEYLKLEVLRMKYPAVYELLYKESDTLLKLSDEARGIYTYTLAEFEKDGEGHRRGDIVISQMLHKRATEFHIKNQEIEKIIDLIKELFGNQILSARFSKNLSIVHPSKFALYFAYTMVDGVLSEIEFSNARLGKLPEFKKKVELWISQDKTDDVQKRFIQIRTFDNRNDFENVIRAMFHFYRCQNGTSLAYLNFRDLIDKLYNRENRVSNLYYDRSVETYQNFIRVMFQEAKSPYLFEANFIRAINTQLEPDFPLEKEERITIVTGYFARYEAAVKTFDDNFWNLFHACTYADYINNGNGSFSKKEITSEEAKLTFIKMARKNFDQFLYDMISLPPFEKNTAAVNEFILRIFQDWKGFEVFLGEQSKKESQYLKEFLRFYEVFKSADHKIYVSFSFEVIPVRMKYEKYNS